MRSRSMPRCFRLLLHALRERIARQRRVSLESFFERLGQERSALYAELEAGSGNLSETMSELRLTLVAATDLASALTGAVAEIDTVVTRFDEDPVSDADSEPLDVKDLRDAAIETSEAAKSLTILLQEAGSLMDSPAFASLLSSIDRDTDAIVNGLFWRSLAVVLVLLAGLAGIRLLPNRTSRR